MPLLRHRYQEILFDPKDLKESNNLLLEMRAGPAVRGAMNGNRYIIILSGNWNYHLH